jgi:hypothetical protein
MADELLTFIETGVFTRRVQALGLEASLQRLQAELLANPEAGDVEPGTGGLRKIRMADPSRGKGKRSGARVREERNDDVDWRSEAATPRARREDSRRTLR